MTDAPGPPRPGPARLLTAAALSGAAVMLFELTATRVLAPAFGASLYTWTNVIGVVLLALTLGYALGGALADRRPGAGPLGVILLLAAALSLPAPFLSVRLGVWLLPAPDALTPFEATPHVIRGSLAATLLLFAPPVFLLGMVSPYVVRCLEDRGLRGGRAAGRTLAAGTLGSLVGTYLPAHFLIGVIGTRGTLLTGTALLGLAGLLVSLGTRPRVAGAVLVIVSLLSAAAARGLPVRGPVEVAAGTVSGHETGVVLERESPYQYVRVSSWEIPGKRPAESHEQLRLSLDEGVLEYQSLRDALHDPLTGGAYYDYLALLPNIVRDAGERPLSVAILGGGAGTLARSLRELQAERVERILDVELDPDVAALGPRFGWEPELPDRQVVGDGRVVLRTCEGPFDLIILDAYARQIDIPAHLATREFFELVRERLSDRGLVALNVSTPSLDAPLFRALWRTLGEVFPTVAVMVLPGDWWNVILVASPAEASIPLPEPTTERLERTRRAWLRGWLPLERLPSGGGLLLTDDRAPLDQLGRRR